MFLLRGSLAHVQADKTALPALRKGSG